jgi:amino acid transporter
MSSLFFLLSFIVVNAAVIRLRRERPNMTRPYEVPFYPVTPLLGIALNGVLTLVLVAFILRTNPLAILFSGGWMALGGVLYLAVVRNVSAPGTTEPAGAETTTAPGDDA